MISKLTNLNAITVPTEPQPEEVTPQPPAPPPSSGIAGAADSFESANQTDMNYSNMFQQHSDPGSLPAAPMQTVDASSMFEQIAESQEPVPPAPPEPAAGGLGQTLEDFAEKKVTDTYEQKTTKDFGPDPESKTWTDSTTLGDTEMPNDISSLGSGGGTTVGELKGSWNAFEFGQIDEKAEGDWGSAYAKGSTQVLGVSGEIYYKAGVDTEKKTVTVGVGAKGSLEIVGAHYEAGYKTPPINIGDETVDINGKVNFDAYVGATGKAEADLTVGWGEANMKFGAGGFDGAHASTAGEIGVGDLGKATGNLKGWTGIGAKAEFGAGYKDGKVNVDMGLGLSLGIGAEWDLGFQVDFSELADTGLEVMKDVGLEEEAEWIENTVNDGIGFVGDAAHWAGDAAEDAAGEIGDAAEDAGDAIGDALDEIGDAAEDVGDTAGDVVGDIGDTLDDWF